MGQTLKFSVALCTYNGADYLPEQLESICQQRRLPDELVICDDGSTDTTPSILENFAHSAPFPVHVYYNITNLGSTQNFAQAIERCQGDIIVLCDQDDWWFDHKLALLEATFLEQPAVGGVFTNAVITDAHLNSLGYTLWDTIKFNARKRRLFRNHRGLEVLFQNNVATGATMAFRASYREIILPIPPVWVHDGWIALLIAVVGQLAMLEEPTIAYRQHGHNQIGAQRRSLLKHLHDAPSQERQRFLDRRDEYLAVRERLNGVREVWRHGPVNDLFNEKIRHLNARGTLPEQRLRRLPIVLRELITRRYHRYSLGGLYSFMADLLL